MTATFRVVKPGLLTTVQDLGRPWALASGVSPGGAMDRFAHQAANLLAGNDVSAATLECTLAGPRLVAERDCVVAITGGDLDPRIDGAEAPMWASVRIAAGGELTFGSRKSGVRAYLAIAGGLLADRWLGSLSTDLLVARGGLHGRTLASDDVIETGQALVEEEGRALAPRFRPDYSDHTLYAIPGPQSRPGLFGSAYTVGLDSNRMGFRLDGDALDHRHEEILSFVLVAGAVQVPRDGRAILLMADHQTAGGYPVAAVVVSAAMRVAAQLAPGDELRFEEVSIERALELRAAQRAALDSLTI